MYAVCSFIYFWHHTYLSKDVLGDRTAMRHPIFLTEALVFFDGGMCRKKRLRFRWSVAYLIALPMTLVAIFHRFKMIQKYPWLHNKSKQSAAHTQQKKEHMCPAFFAVPGMSRCRYSLDMESQHESVWRVHRSSQIPTLSPFGNSFHPLHDYVRMVEQKHSPSKSCTRISDEKLPTWGFLNHPGFSMKGSLTIQYLMGSGWPHDLESFTSMMGRSRYRSPQFQVVCESSKSVKC